MRVLVTGGAGFIGSHATEALLELGAEVIIVDDLRSGSLENIENIRDRVTFLKCCVLDLCNGKDFPHVDAVVHLAAIPSVQASLDHPVETHRVNYEATLAVAEACRKTHCKRIVFASSAAVYGTEGNLPLNELSPLKPISHYGADKLASETILSVYADLYRLETVSLRFFNVFGPRQDPKSPYSGVMSLFIEAARNGNRITVYGDGHQTRDFVFVKDLAGVIAKATLAPGAPPRIMNVATGEATSLNDILEIIRSSLKSPLEVTYQDRRSGDIRHSQGDPSRINAWDPEWKTTSVASGLSQLLTTAPQ